MEEGDLWRTNEDTIISFILAWLTKKITPSHKPPQTFATALIMQDSVAWPWFNFANFVSAKDSV